MDNWKTPDWIMNIFAHWFDPCPLNKNPDIDGLRIEWLDQTYVNPPYSNPLPWVEKAIEENKKGKTIAMLLKADTSTKYFYKLLEAKAQILWINRRLRFSNSETDAPFGCMLVILNGSLIERKTKVYKGGPRK